MYVIHNNNLAEVELPVRESLFKEYQEQHGNETVIITQDTQELEVRLDELQDYSIWRNT